MYNITHEYCEEKYNVINWIPEYYNIISNIYYIFSSLYLCLSPSLCPIGITTIMIGIGSTMKHTIYNYYGTILFEISILYYYFQLYKLLCPEITNICFLPFLWLYNKYNSTDPIFTTYSILLQLGITFYIWKYTTMRKIKRIYFILLSSYVLIWLTDKYMCEYMINIQPHALTHIISAIIITIQTWNIWY